MKLILRILINAVALWITTLLLPAVNIQGNIVGLIVVAVVFGLVNALIRPIIQILTLPISCLTLGLFTLVINALMVLITSWIAGNYLTIQGQGLEKFIWALVAAIIISIVSALLSWVIPDKPDRG